MKRSTMILNHFSIQKKRKQKLLLTEMNRSENQAACMLCESSCKVRPQTKNKNMKKAIISYHIIFVKI